MCCIMKDVDPCIVLVERVMECEYGPALDAHHGPGYDLSGLN